MAKSRSKKSPGSIGSTSIKQDAKEDAMAIQYLLVTYPDPRPVLADGEGVGFTNHTLLLPADEYKISLDGSGYQPASQTIALSGTSLVRPMVVSFTPVALVVPALPVVPVVPAVAVAPVAAAPGIKGKNA